MHNGTSRLIRGIKEQNKKLMVVIKTVVSFYLFILIINYITADTNASFTSNNEVNISIDAWVEEQEDTDATGDQLEQDENNPDGENSNQDKENQSETNTVKPERQVNETNEGDSAQADFNKKANEDHANSTEQKQASQSAAEKDSKGTEDSNSTTEPTKNEENNN